MELKFRAWHKEHNKYYDVIELSMRCEFCTVVVKSIEEDEEFPFDMFMFDDVIIEQYTGLKDKNGKDIYEGDIVKGVFNHLFSEFKVFAIPNPLERYKYNSTYNDEDIEIIGNIHENEDLVERGM